MKMLTLNPYNTFAFHEFSYHIGIVYKTIIVYCYKTKKKIE